MRFRFLVLIVFLLTLLGASMPAVASAHATSQLESRNQVVTKLPRYAVLTAYIFQNGRNEFRVFEQGRGFPRGAIVHLVTVRPDTAQSLPMWPREVRTDRYGNFSIAVTVYSSLHHRWFLCVAQAIRPYIVAYRYVYRQ